MYIKAMPHYKMLLSIAQRDLSNYQAREKQLEKIRNNYLILNSYAMNLNSDCKKVLRNSYTGILISGGSNDADLVFGKYDNGSGDDHLYSSKKHIEIEIQRVQEKIGELKRKIVSYEDSIEQEKMMERMKKEVAENTEL